MGRHKTHSPDIQQSRHRLHSLQSLQSVLMSLLRLLFLFVSVFAQQQQQQQSCEDVVIKWTLWNEPGPGLAATVNVLVEEELQSWAIGLSFNKHFTKLNFFNGLSEATSGSNFTVVNESWSGHKHPGDHIKFSLLGDYAQDNTDEISLQCITLQGKTVVENCPN